MRRSATFALYSSVFCLSGLLACSSGNEPPPNPGNDAGDLDAGGLLDTGTSTRTDGGLSSDGGGPVPDAGMVVDECNPITQDCADPTKHLCVVEPVMAGSGTSCVEPSTTAVALNGLCTAFQCAPGLGCVRTGTAARCLQICDRTSGAPCSTLGTDFDCRLSIRGTNWGACQQLPPLCDIFTQAPCGAGQACQPVQRFGGSFEIRCRGAGTGTEGMSCENGAGCVRGLVCVHESSGTLCRKPCRENMNDCTAPQTCSGTVLSIRYCR